METISQPSNRPKYEFSERDRFRQRSFGKDPFGSSYGFWFCGDETRPKGLYSNDGIYYGDRGEFSEMDLMLDLLVQNQAKMLSGYLKIAAIGHQNLQNASEATRNVLAENNGLLIKLIGGK